MDDRTLFLIMIGVCLTGFVIFSVWKSKESDDNYSPGEDINDLFL
jgi:hypothetical protein